MRALYALHNTWTPVLIGLAALALNILLSLVAVRWLDHGGLALTNSVATAIETLILLWLVRNRLGGIDGSGLLTSLGKSALAATIMTLAEWGWMRWLPTLGELGQNPWVVGLSSLGLAGVVYLLASLVLKSEEVRLAPATVLRR